jgi:hypothetical protein
MLTYAKGGGNGRIGIHSFHKSSKPTALHAVAQWLRHCATNRKFMVSIQDGVIGIFHWHNPPGRTMALVFTQYLTEMSTRNIPSGYRWPVRKANKLTTFRFRFSWNLEISTSTNPQGLSRPVMGLLYLYLLPTGSMKNRSCSSSDGNVEPSQRASGEKRLARTARWRTLDHATFRQFDYFGTLRNRHLTLQQGIVLTVTILSEGRRLLLKYHTSFFIWNVRVNLVCCMSRFWYQTGES